jgi:hypothetical protein
VSGAGVVVSHHIVNEILRGVLVVFLHSSVCVFVGVLLLRLPFSEVLGHLLLVIMVVCSAVSTKFTCGIFVTCINAFPESDIVGDFSAAFIADKIVVFIMSGSTMMLKFKVVTEFTLFFGF